MNYKRNHENQKTFRSGLRDIWNADMCIDANWSPSDIPFCRTILTDAPKNIFTWTEARALCGKKIKKNKAFKDSSFVCFYEDDYKFDGPIKGIWANPRGALKILRHFRGIVTPDFSTYQDFPYPLKIYNTYRMRAFGKWCGENGLEVINNVRWGTSESFSYCFDGIEKESAVAIGTVGGNPRRLVDRDRFIEGLREMNLRLKPKLILVYGSSQYKCLKELQAAGIRVLSFEGSTSKAFRRGLNHE